MKAMLLTEQGQPLEEHDIERPERGFDQVLIKVKSAVIKTAVTKYPLSQANQALEDLRNGEIQGAAVLESSRPQLLAWN